MQVENISETLNLDIRMPKLLKDNDEEYEFIKSLNPDLAIVVAYGKIIPKKFIFFPIIVDFFFYVRVVVIRILHYT